MVGNFSLHWHNFLDLAVITKGRLPINIKKKVKALVAKGEDIKSERENQ